MTFDEAVPAGTICTCDFKPVPLEVLITPAYNQALAHDCTRNGTGATCVHLALLDELLTAHAGRLFDYDGEIDLLSSDRNGDDYLDRSLGVDAVSRLQRFLDTARAKPTYRLRKEHRSISLLLSFSRAIHRCRAVGFCAQRAARLQEDIG